MRKQCKSCKYRGKIQSINGCDYIYLTGKMRNCSPKECDKYEQGKRVKRKSSPWGDGSYLED